MATIQETVTNYIEKIEKNNISIKTLYREILEIEETIGDSTGGMIAEIMSEESKIEDELSDIMAGYMESTATDHYVLWKTYYDADFTTPVAPPNGRYAPENSTRNIAFGWNEGVYSWAILPGVSTDSSRSNHVDKWVVGYTVDTTSSTTYHVVSDYNDFQDNTSLVEATNKWNLLFQQIAKPAGLDGAYGLESQIDSKMTAINFLNSENAFMETFVENFG